MPSSQPHSGSESAQGGHGPGHAFTSCFSLPASTGFPPVSRHLGFTCCFTGCVILFQFIQPPPPGSILGTLTSFTGCSLPLVQTHPTPHGEIPLAAVDRQFATLCGDLVLVHGRVALDVKCVFPGPHPSALQPFSCFAV